MIIVSKGKCWALHSMPQGHKCQVEMGISSRTTDGHLGSFLQKEGFGLEASELQFRNRWSRGGAGEEPSEVVRSPECKLGVRFILSVLGSR